MRHVALTLGLLAIGCSTQETTTPPRPTSSPPAASATTTAKPVGNSPLHVVLQSKTKVVFAGLADGVWISEGPGGRLAQAEGSSELESGPMPEGLPESWGRVLHAAGRLRRVWLSLELEEKGDNNLPKTPLYRFDGQQFRRIAEDWRPLITIWSNKRPLAMWTSAGKLKAKVPLHEPERPDDLPGAKLDDERCPYNLRLDALAGLSTGEVFALGTCSPTGASGVRSVVVQWPDPKASEPEPEQTPPPSTAAPTAEPAAAHTSDAGPTIAAPTAAPTSAPSASSTAAVAVAPDTTAAPVIEEPETTVRGHVWVLPGPEHKLAHGSLVALSPSEVLVAGVDLDSKPQPKSYVLRFDGTSWTPIELPSQEQVRGIAKTADGVLWLATEHGIWSKTGTGAWERVVPPWVAAAEVKWTFQTVFAVADTVWISAELGTGQHVVLRTRPAKSQITW